MTICVQLDEHRRPASARGLCAGGGEATTTAEALPVVYTGAPHDGSVQ